MPGLRWYFTDHLATPILQTAQTAAVAWRVEYERGTRLDDALHAPERQRL